MLRRHSTLRRRLRRTHHSPTDHDDLLPNASPDNITTSLVRHDLSLIGTRTSRKPNYRIARQVPVAPRRGDTRPCHRIGIDLALRYTVRPLAKLLRSLRCTRPFLFISRIDVHHRASTPTDKKTKHLRIGLLLHNCLRPTTNGRPRT